MRLYRVMWRELFVAASNGSMQPVQDIDFPAMKKGRLGLSNKVSASNACLAMMMHSQSFTVCKWAYHRLICRSSWAPMATELARIWTTWKHSWRTKGSKVRIEGGWSEPSWPFTSPWLTWINDLLHSGKALPSSLDRHTMACRCHWRAPPSPSIPI